MCDSTAGKMRIEPAQGERLWPPGQQDPSYRLLPEGEDPADLPADQRIADLAQAGMKFGLISQIISGNVLHKYQPTAHPIESTVSSVACSCTPTVCRPSMSRIACSMSAHVGSR